MSFGLGHRHVDSCGWVNQRWPASGSSGLASARGIAAIGESNWGIGNWCWLKIDQHKVIKSGYMHLL